MKLLGLAIAAAAIILPQSVFAQEKVGFWTIQGAAAECKAYISSGTGATRREFAFTATEGYRILTFFAPGWTFAATDQPQVAVNFVGPDVVWPNMTAVVEMASGGGRVLHIGFVPERTAELDALVARSGRLQLTNDGRELGVFETPDAGAAVAALQRCDAAR